MPLVQVLYLRVAYPAPYRSVAVAYAETFALDASPGSVKQVMFHVIQQSVSELRHSVASFHDSQQWECVTYTFVREDFLPTFVPYLRGLYTSGLTRGQAQLVSSILAVSPTPPVAVET